MGESYHRTFIFHRRYDKASACSPSTPAFIFQRGGVKADISVKLKQEGSFSTTIISQKMKGWFPCEAICWGST